MAKGSDVIWCGSPVIEVYGKLLRLHPYRFGRVIVQHTSSNNHLTISPEFTPLVDMHGKVSDLHLSLRDSISTTQAARR